MSNTVLRDTLCSAQCQNDTSDYCMPLCYKTFDYCTRTPIPVQTIPHCMNGVTWDNYGMQVSPSINNTVNNNINNTCHPLLGCKK